MNSRDLHALTGPVMPVGTLECAIALMDLAGRLLQDAAAHRTTTAPTSASKSFRDMFTEQRSSTADQLEALAQKNTALAERIIDHHLTLMPAPPATAGSRVRAPAGGPRDLMNVTPVEYEEGMDQ